MLVTHSNGSELWDSLPHCSVLASFPGDCHSQQPAAPPGWHSNFLSSFLASSLSTLQPPHTAPPNQSPPYAIFCMPWLSSETNRGKALLNCVDFLLRSLAFNVLYNLVPNIHSKCIDPSSEATQILSIPVRLVYLCLRYFHNSATWIEKERSFDQCERLHLAPFACLKSTQPSLHPPSQWLTQEFCTDVRWLDGMCSGAHPASPWHSLFFPLSLHFPPLD